MLKIAPKSGKDASNAWTDSAALRVRPDGQISMPPSPQKLKVAYDDKYVENCAPSLTVTGLPENLMDYEGTYFRANIWPFGEHGDRPVYEKQDRPGVYMRFYVYSWLLKTYKSKCIVTTETSWH